jgi:hypothetical protein
VFDGVVHLLAQLCAGSGRQRLEDQTGAHEAGGAVAVVDSPHFECIARGHAEAREDRHQRRRRALICSRGRTAWRSGRHSRPGNR